MAFMNRKGRLRIGTSGFQYDHWRESFYPKDLSRESWFQYYARFFDTVEINNTFYRLPAAKTFDSWREKALAGFCYALKFSRYGTHVKRLKDPRQPVRLFVQRAERLRDSLGPILVQLPPKWDLNLDRLTAFLETIPVQVRWALEFRDERWLCKEVYDLLEKHNVALCIHDMIENHPRKITADWIYLRYHGDRYQGSYSPQALTSQARWIRELRDAGMDVFAYFNNDVHGHAVNNARDLKRYLEN